MLGKRKSFVWDYFDKTEFGGICNLCKCYVKTSGNTTNLQFHLEQKHSSVSTHMKIKTKICRTSKTSTTSTMTSISDDVDNPDIVKPVTHFSDLANNIVNEGTLNNMIIDPTYLIESVFSKSSRSTSTSSIGSVSGLSDIRSYEQKGLESRAITDALVYMLAKDNLPLSTTENPGFVYFMNKVVPMYKVPSRKKVTCLIKNKYEVLSTLVKNKLSLVENITLTSDIWTDTINTKNFLSVTAHFINQSKLALENVTIGVLELAENHTSVYISQWFELLLNDWGISKDQVVTVVTDGGANILSAVKTSFGPEKHLLCFAHTLNLVAHQVLDNLKDVQSIINKIKSIVTLFKHHVPASNGPRKLCYIKLKQFVPNRWNSIFYMIDRFISCSNHIASVLIYFHLAPLMLSESEINIAKEMLLVLKPFELATQELCGQNYIASSKVIPIVHCLIRNMEVVVVTNSIVQELKCAMLDNLHKHFGRVEETLMLSIATILDPRFKNIHSNDRLAFLKAILTIKQKNIEIKTSESNLNIGSSDKDNDPANSLWYFHNELVSNKAASEHFESNQELVLTDLKHYLNQPTIPLNEDILRFWKLNGNMYPHLKKIVDHYLCIVATSVPSERLFSKAGNIMTDKRIGLHGEKLQQLLFLGSLDFDDWHLD